MHRKLAHTLLTATWLLGCTAWAAEQAPVRDSGSLLPEILVVGKRGAVQPGISYEETTPADFRAWNANTAADALTQTPGVNVQYGAESGDARAWIRGFRDRSVLVLYDGIPVASAFEGTIDLNEIAIEGVGKIRTMTAAPSVIYGTNGIGGVIDVVPETVPDKRQMRGQFEAGANDSVMWRGSYANRFDTLGLVAALSHEEADDYRLSDNYRSQLNQEGSKRVNSDFERDSLFLRLAHQSSTLGESSLLVNVSDNQRGTPPQAGAEDPDYERLTKSLRRTIGLSHRSPGQQLAIKLFYTGYDYELKSYTDASYDEVEDIERAEDYSFGAKAYATLSPLEDHSLVLSAAALEEAFDSEGAFDDSDTAKLRTYNLAIEDEWWPRRNVSLALGGIYTYFDQVETGQASTAFNPQIVASYRASTGLSFRASAAQRTRFPKLRELYRRRYGNPDLREEKANSYEIGARYLSAFGLEFDAAIFSIDVDGLIDRPTRNSAYANLDESDIDGIEVSAGGQLRAGTYLRAGYSYVDAAERLEDGGERQLRSRPKHTVFAEIRHRLDNGVALSLNAIYVDELYDVDDAGGYDKIPSYVVAHFKCSIPLTDALEVYASVSNIADENYEQKLGYPREGRAASVGLRLEI